MIEISELKYSYSYDCCFGARSVHEQELIIQDKQSKTGKIEAKKSNQRKFFELLVIWVEYNSKLYLRNIFQFSVSYTDLKRCL